MATPRQELRVHGVSGTPPRSILYTDPVSDDPAESSTKIYRRRVTDPCFETTAFHWANLTSGSRITAFWILLGPFALANAAGWMAGWRQGATDAGARALAGRAAVRAAGVMLSALLVAQGITAGVLLPWQWLRRAEKSLLVWRFELGAPSEELAVTVLAALVATAFYLLFAVVSTRTHYATDERRRAWDLLFSPSGAGMERHTESLGGRRIGREDPAGVRLTDPLMWSKHSMLHRMRRLHFAAVALLFGGTLLVFTGVATVAIVVGLVALVALLGSLLTTLAPRSGLVWSITAVLPLVSLAVVAAGFVSIWTAAPGEWAPDDLHRITFGVAAVLGLYTLLSLLAGPLSAGALVLAAFFGAVLGMVVGLFLDKALGVGQLEEQGAGWIAGVMLFLLLWLVLVALFLALRGHPEPERGATSPLSSGLGRRLRMLGRRVVVRSRRLLDAAVAFGAVWFVVLSVQIWEHGTIVRSEADAAAVWPLNWWYTLVRGMEPAALIDFPTGWVNVAMTVAVAIPGGFLIRSIYQGWGGGRSGSDKRRQVGILWDLGSFWPRWFHPLAPPAYGPKAVADLMDALDDRSRTAILGAHSQGSLIAAVAMQQRDRSVGFVTYGSQLGILYPSMFPQVGIDDVVTWLASRDTPWHNLWRDTDPIGGHHVDVDGVVNVRVTEGVGHGGHETTGAYAAARRAIAGLDPDERCGPGAGDPDSYDAA